MKKMQQYDVSDKLNYHINEDVSVTRIVNEEQKYVKMANEARRRALYTGVFTDDPSKIADDVYLVEDINLVIKAFLKDIEEGDVAKYDEPADFLDKHGIKWI